MKLRLVFMHAIAVVPEPIQLSSTVSPLFVYVLIRYSNNLTGFCVGCKFLVLSVDFIFITDEGDFILEVFAPPVVTVPVMLLYEVEGLLLCDFSPSHIIGL